MRTNNEAFADTIAQLCFDKYTSLSKNGKPVKEKEWTLLAGFVIEQGNLCEVVSLATGTKCIGRNSMTADGTILNDSHAEVLARRCLLRFFYHQLENVKKGQSSKLFKKHKLEEDKFEVFDFKLHMFTSHIPCGDASIFPKEGITLADSKLGEGIVEQNNKRQNVHDYNNGAGQTEDNVIKDASVRKDPLFSGVSNTKEKSKVILKNILVDETSRKNNFCLVTESSNAFNVNQNISFHSDDSESTIDSSVDETSCVNSANFHNRSNESMKCGNTKPQINYLENEEFPQKRLSNFSSVHPNVPESENLIDGCPAKKRKLENCDMIIEIGTNYNDQLVIPSEINTDSLNQAVDVSKSFEAKSVSSSPSLTNRLDSSNNSKIVEHQFEKCDVFCESSDNKILVNRTNETFQPFEETQIQSSTDGSLVSIQVSNSTVPRNDGTISDENVANACHQIGFCKDIDFVGNIITDINRTGAKCLPSYKLQDAKDPGVGYHVIGVVRTKPGRGDPTLSVSCSDKIARWVAVGVQGALLSILLDKPIQIASITVGGGGPYSAKSMFRALILRSNTDQRPLLCKSQLVFESSRYIMNMDSRPCSSSIMWADVPLRPCEVSARGYRLGATKTAGPLEKATNISCRHLYKRFIRLTEERYLKMTYAETKTSSIEYSNAWMKAKANMGSWTVKDSKLKDFKIDDQELIKE